ncbi:MAG TPA: TlpA disulfide reductase family protein [Chitinophagaceae bacterium]|jgi:thiol-disulfide isomerase/thioredoxin|nr:TlpA disulfide reductase family protein [Chitinophagaceae bacterium]
MKKLFVAAVMVSLVSCKGKEAGKAFEVSGIITNNSAKMIYLEELPMATMQAVIVDSAEVGKNGKYSLHADEKESSVYNLRLDRSAYPFAAVINDTKKVTVDVTFSKEDKEFPEKYEVKGSESSQQMKDFMFAFNSQLQAIFFNDSKVDSLRKAGAPDSVWMKLNTERDVIATSARSLVDESVKKSNNPALNMFILGYYQTTANNPNYRLIALNNEEVKKLVNDIATKFPAHTGLAGIKKSLAGWVGTPAPEIALPDPDGKTVTLSSFKGKYVLVDFWASWCRPCRQENPNVVKAWNRFKGKNFTILGVSLDMEGQKDKWLKAVMDDKLTWNHVSDLQYWNSPVVPLYNINGIPYNVLVDPEGKIIAEKLFGAALEEKLAEVLE